MDKYRHLTPKDVKPIRCYILSMSQAELADYLEVKRATVEHWERGRNKFSEESRKRFENFVFSWIDPPTLFYLLEEYEKGNETIKKGSIE
ncbi:MULTISPECIES: helix-turn-helix domain-containing protein [Heyndrickxia]|uniref:helix-turn-helix domain-containing protein n=1 Tax=Heyndrickxia TaxID=2837504 RepID=UPI002DB8B5E7|nr:helix-turn-helix domain-containing protein [Weizmannia sp. CD-2023]MEC2225020.1 helix-turn-helix domain-containing protein [Weizmannia sp. CD-2023]